MMYLDDLPLVFVSRLEVALRFHSAEGTRPSTTSSSRKVIDLKFVATLFLSVAATSLLSNESISTFDEALSRLSPKLGKYCVLSFLVLVVVQLVLFTRQSNRHQFCLPMKPTLWNAILLDVLQDLHVFIASRRFCHMWVGWGEGWGVGEKGNSLQWFFIFFSEVPGILSCLLRDSVVLISVLQFSC